MPLKFNKLISILEANNLTIQQIKDYASLLTGQVGRIIFSTIFFVAITNALSIENLGLFVSTSAIGLVASRLLGFGFVSPLYRIATTRPTLIGVYSAGYILAVIASLPLIMGITGLVYFFLYYQYTSIESFAYILIAEIILWRSYEVLIIVLNGQEKFTLASLLTIVGIANKACVALGFYLWGDGQLASWALIYCLSNAVLAPLSIALFYPRRALRWAPKAWIGRSRDALNVSLAEILFNMQAELDKVLVLALGGEVIAGLYSLLMRLIDLTALPIRAFNTMIIQIIMRKRTLFQDPLTKWKIDTGIFILSSLGLCALALLLWLMGDWPGENIALVASFLLFALLVPAFRNLIEYHSELLYAHELMRLRIALLALLAVIKFGFLTIILSASRDFTSITLGLNAMFLMLYCISAYFTYRRI